MFTKMCKCCVFHMHLMGNMKNAHIDIYIYAHIDKPF